MIRVRAVFPYGGFGFDGRGRRYDGDEFEVDESLFSDKWMELVDVDEPALEDEDNEEDE